MSENVEDDNLKVSDGIVQSSETNVQNRGSEMLEARGSCTYKQSVSLQGAKEEEATKRVQWGSSFEFLMVLMGYAIGIGNVWRFPYVAAKYGGGTFVFVYLVMLVLCAFPLFFYEMLLGQFYQKGPVQVFQQLHPRFRGLAYISGAMSMILLTYYQIVISVATTYLGQFIIHGGSTLPWDEPGTSSRQFYNKEVLNKAEYDVATGVYTPDENALQGSMVLMLFVVWFATFASLFFGLHVAGKLAIVMVIFPFLILIILIIQSAMLEGAGKGIAYYLAPRLDQFANLNMYGAALGQVLFSLGPGMGSGISLSSLNPRKYKRSFTDAIWVASSNSVSSLMAGFVVFAILGHMAGDKPIKDVLTEGPELTFVVFARGFSTMPGGHIMGILFFFMLVLIGFDSAFAWVQTLQVYFMEVITWWRPIYKKKGIPEKYTRVTLTFLCVTLFLLGLPYCTNRGSYYLEIVDHYCPMYCLLCVCFFEYVALGWILGIDKFWDMVNLCLRDPDSPERPLLKMIIGFQIKYVGPILLFALSMGNLIGEFLTSDLNKKNYDGLYVYHGYDTSLIIVGWLSFFFPTLFFIWFLFFPIDDRKKIIDSEAPSEMDSVPGMPGMKAPEDRE